MFQRLWVLCQHTEPFVREVFEQNQIKYPFVDAATLFAEVVRDMVDSRFALCIKPYVECSRTKTEKRLRLEAKAYAGIPLNTTQRKIVKAQQQGQTPVASFVLRIARKAAKEEIIIQDALEDFNVACSRLLKCFATEVHNLRGYKWIDGCIVRESDS